MNAITLFDYWRSSASYRVRIVLNLKNVPYTRVPTSLLDNAQKAPAYVARNPQGFVPMLSIDGHDLTQSLAIIDYLDAKYPEPAMLSSNAADRAKTLAQALIIAADIHPIDNLRVLRYLKDELGNRRKPLIHGTGTGSSKGSRRLRIWRRAMDYLAATCRTLPMSALSRKWPTRGGWIRLLTSFPNYRELMRR